MQSYIIQNENFLESTAMNNSKRAIKTGKIPAKTKAILTKFPPFKEFVVVTGSPQLGQKRL
jgi:hypothetical protein